MILAYTIPGIAALAVWLLAAALYAVGWYRLKPGLNRLGDSLGVVGIVSATIGALWLALGSVSIPALPDLALVRSSLTTGLAVSALVVYAILGHQRTERLSALAMLVFAIPTQALAVGQLLRSGAEAWPLKAFLPVWMALGTLTGLAGYGGLATSAMMILLVFVLSRIRDRLLVDQLAAGIGLRTLEWRAWQIALVALSVSVSIGLIRAFWGLGQVMLGGISWALITWLLVAASSIGLMLGADRPRLARILLVLACAVGIVSVLTWAGPWS